MFGVFSELTFFGKLTFWRLTISPSISFPDLKRTYDFQDSAQFNGFELEDLDEPRLPDEGLRSRQDGDAETIFLDQICKRDSKDM
jgi:hypothetical protein